MNPDLLSVSAALPQQGQQRKGGQVRRQPPSSSMGRARPARARAVQPNTFPSPPRPGRRPGSRRGPPRRAAAPPRHTPPAATPPVPPPRWAHPPPDGAPGDTGAPPQQTAAGSPGAGRPQSARTRNARPPERGRARGTAIAWQKGSGSALRSPCPSSAGQSGKSPPSAPAVLLHGTGPPPPAPPVSSACHPADRGGPAPTPADSAGPAPAPPSPPGGGPAAPPAPQFPPTPSPREQDMRRGPVYAGGGYRKRRGLVPPALLFFFSWRRRNLRSSSAASLWRCRCARSALRASRWSWRACWAFVPAPVFSGRFRACRRARLDLPARWTPGRLYRWTKVQAPPRRQEPLPNLSILRLGAEGMAAHLQAPLRLPLIHAHPEGVGKPDRQPRIAAFHMKLSSLNIGLARSADNQGGRLLTVPGAGRSPGPRPDYQPGRVFRSAL